MKVLLWWRFLREQVEQGGQRLMQRIQLYSFESICRMMEAGVGVGVIPDSAARRYSLAGMKLQVVELDEPWVTRERKLLAHDVDALPACAKVIIEQIRETHL
jgi:DNA-binding transcriptional LysR family regulator